MLRTDNALYFYEGSLLSDSNSVSNWAIFFSAAIKLIIQTVVGVILYSFFKSIGVVAFLIGAYAGISWFCWRFFKKNKRCMTVEEYKNSKRKLIIFYVSFDLTFAAICLIPYAVLWWVASGCHQLALSSKECSFVMSAVGQVPSLSILLFAGIFVVVIILFATWCFVTLIFKRCYKAFCADYSLRSVKK